jgi:arachidonate 15-lipoxygenase
MTPTLPQDDPNPSARAAQLASARDELPYAWDRPSGVAMAASVPKRLGYPLGVIAQVAAAEAHLAANKAAVRLREGFHPAAPSDPSTRASCGSLFAAIAAPPVLDATSDAATSDLAFAWQRVAGPLPLLLRRATESPAGFPRDRRVDSLLDEGRLYVADWRVLEGIPAGTAGDLQKYVAAPVALFGAGADRRLFPLAIRCGQSPDLPVFTPNDGVAWEMAKATVQVADANVEESFYHLGRAHFLTEAFALATERQLARNHPLFALLSPHFEGTIAINGAARDQLVVPGGQLEELLAPTLDGSLDLVRLGISTFRLQDLLLPRDLALRGVDEADLDYPWRDDARAMWRAIEAFVRDYVAIAWPDDAAVGADTELRAWLDELRSPKGGRIAGLPTALATRADVVPLVTWIVFNASAGHAGLNYTQSDFMAYAPNMQTAGYAPPPTGALADVDAAWSAMLPNRDLAEKQLAFMYQQSQVRDNQLGKYPRGQFADPRVQAPLDRFQAALATAEQEITARERSRFLPYPYLLPSRLTASIHI